MRPSQVIRGSTLLISGRLLELPSARSLARADGSSQSLVRRLHPHPAFRSNQGARAFPLFASTTATPVLRKEASMARTRMSVTETKHKKNAAGNAEEQTHHPKRAFSC